MKRLNNVLVIIMILGALGHGYASVISGNTYGIFVKMSILITIFIPKIFNKLFKIKIPKSLEISYLIFIFIGHFLGSVVGLYHMIDWYDTFAHFMSGILVSLIATYIVNNKIKKDSLYVYMLFVISFSALIALGWEILEFTGDQIFKADAQDVLTTGVTDTMKDMIMALLASILYSITYLYEKYNNKNGIVNRYIKSLKKH